jgi:hypothetical protein
MKRIFTLVLITIVSLQMFAQKMTGPAGNELTPAEKLSFLQSKEYFKQHALNKTNATDGGWYNYNDALTNSGLGTLTNFYFHLFNDSSVQTLYKNSTTQLVETNHIYTHHLGMAIDPRGDCYDGDPFQSNRFTRYTMDSIAIAYGYRRHNPDANIVDTLVIQVYSSTAGRKNSLSGSQAVCMYVDYNYQANSGASTFKTIKVPLTASDTAMGSKVAFAVLNPPLDIPASGQAIVTYKYVSGQVTNFGDTVNADYDTTIYKITNRVNELRVFMAQDASSYDQSTAADPTYNRIYNNGLIGFSVVRYNMSTNGWNGFLIPGNAYTPHYVPDLNMKITSTNVGINNAAKEYLKDVQVYPNPTNGANAVAVEYKLTKTANVTIEVVNILGKKVSSVNAGTNEAGTQTQMINVSELANGIYFANIIVDGVAQSVKFTVSK